MDHKQTGTARPHSGGDMQYGHFFKNLINIAAYAPLEVGAVVAVGAVGLLMFLATRPSSR